MKNTMYVSMVVVSETVLKEISLISLRLLTPSGTRFHIMMSYANSKYCTF